MKTEVLISTPSEKSYFQPLSTYAQLNWLEELNEDQLDRILPSVEAIFAFTWPKGLDAKALSKMGKLRFIQCELAGVNSIPFRELGESVMVSSNAGAYSQEVAEYAWGLLLAASKRIVRYDAALRAPDFVRPPAPELGKQVILLKGKTLGVVGYGGIGRTVAAIGKSFGMRICAFSRRTTNDDVELLQGKSGLEKLLRSSDACVLALPLSKLTRDMIGAKELAVMKANGIIVNIARAEIVNESALYDHLVKNPDFVYATDVWWTEDGKESFSPRLPFLKLDNFLGSPHTSGPSALATGEPVRHAVDNLLRFLKHETPQNVVNRSEYV
jgi:phosphoglycerate dehydrogenase-like enzyme